MANTFKEDVLLLRELDKLIEATEKSANTASSPIAKELAGALFPGLDKLIPNNGYNCRHPDCEVVEDGVGCCHGFSCPLASEADEEDCERFGVEFEEGEFVEKHMWREQNATD